MTKDRGFPRPPLPITAPRADHFPTTELTTLLRGLRTVLLDGAQPRVSAAHAQLAETIMSRYAAPLEAYARGSTLREIAEPADLVHGFFASSLADATYFTRYQASGMRMRRWLMNGLLLHARSVARDRAWTVFRRHAIDGRSYIDLEGELGLGRQQMADLVRGVTKRIRARMLELLESEGGDAAEELRDVLRLVS